MNPEEVAENERRKSAAHEAECESAALAVLKEGKRLRPTSKPLSLAQRQAAHRQRRADQDARWKAALEAIQTAKTIREAREIAAAALAS